MSPLFSSVSEAHKVARGKKQSVGLETYYEAWQYLYDNNALLPESDQLYLDKLICDGVVLTPENVDELQGVPYRGITAMAAMQLSDD